MNNFAKRSQLHIKRRVWHILCGVVCLAIHFIYQTDIKFWGVFSLVVAALGFFVDFKRLSNPKINQAFEKYFGPLLRKSERLSFSGLPFYALGVGLSCFLYPEKVAILSIMFLVFADPIASVFGVYYGQDRLLPNKTLQGTIAAFITCFFITMTYLFCLGVNSSNVVLFAFFSAIAGALSELLSAFNIDDNLTIPVVSGVVITLLQNIFSVF